MNQKTVLKEKRKMNRRVLISLAAILLALAVLAAVGFILLRVLDRSSEEKEAGAAPIEDAVEKKEPIEKKWETGFVAALSSEAEYFDENGERLGTLLRGTKVEYSTLADGKIEILSEGGSFLLGEGAHIVSDLSQIIPAHTLYVRTAVNLRDQNGALLPAFAQKGSAVEIVGFDYLLEDGTPHMYKVKLGGEEGFVMPWYLAQTEAEALSNFDGGSYAIHAARGDEYGGGGAADLDYFPREKKATAGNVMPSECRALYLVSWKLGAVEEYIALAKSASINAFVVDIMDGSSIGYASEVMKKFSPSAASAAQHTPEEYRAAIAKIKDAGFYVIGRITTFNDSFFVQDHPEYAIKDTAGNPMKLSGVFWPTPFCRTAWQYKVDLAVEAVKEMGFHEIQFDYVRFPDNVRRYEKAGTADLGNAYGETKAQAIQRFLMYATDIIHEAGAYVSADVYGESAYTYVTTYGQYWPAISGVVDAISGMPYPDHFAEWDGWLPWEHPYETLNNWGKSVMKRQGETASPAVVRTWIQAYNAIRPPYNRYGAEEISAQRRGLSDAGCTGGVMTWHAASSIDKYREIISAF